MNLEDIKDKLKLVTNKDIVSIILYGSYARSENTINSDIDVLIISENKSKKEKLVQQISKISDKFEIIILTRDEFREKVMKFNPQLISIFYDGVVIKDEDDYYKKNRNLFIVLNRKDEYNIKYKNKEYKLSKLVRAYGF